MLPTDNADHTDLKRDLQGAGPTGGTVPLNPLRLRVIRVPWAELFPRIVLASVLISS
jgi:hypothetical protein